MTASSSTCWIITEGLAGLRSQAKGLADHLGFETVEKEVRRPGFPWKLLPAGLWPLSMSLNMGKSERPFGPPWPDVLITCGRNSVSPSIAIRKASGGRTFTVHVQNPNVDPANFNLVIAGQHDTIRGGNVLVTKGALHIVTKEKLEAAKAKFAPVFAALPRPLFAVLVGGTNKHQKTTDAHMRDFGQKLAGIAQQTGGGIALTFSRRTTDMQQQIVRQALEGVPAYIWDGTGDNPYLGLLALADSVIVTSDSVSMTSEACSTGKPVYVYTSGTERGRIRRFQESLLKDGITRPFTGKLETWEYPRLRDNEDAAELVLKELGKWRSR